jgi:hypothetical protein
MPRASTQPADTTQRLQLAAPSANVTKPSDPIPISRSQHSPLRDHLAQWQQQYGGPSEEVLSAFGDHPANGDLYNNISKLSSSFKSDQVEQDDWNRMDDDDGEELITIGLFLKPGDVVELSQPAGE